MDKYIGRLLDNRYEILEVIGTGGMAVVYKARCHRLNRLVAIKILKDDYLEDEDFRRRFHAESQAVAMFSHPNIVSVYDVSTSVSLEADYIVMELIDGITLKQYMEKKGVLNWKETLHFAIQIAKALEHAHSRGIVHRDIKPHNVMVLKNGSIKVADFGIARMMSKGNTLTKEALGSVHYISPEQAKGGRVDSRSDIYSLGVVMYEMITGRPPYDGDTPVSVAIQHIDGGAQMPSTLNPNIPGGLEQIIMKAMAHDIDDRYPTVAGMLSDMDEFRKDPTMLFEYNLPPLEVVTGIKPPLTLQPTTAERVAGRSEGQRRSNVAKNGDIRQRSQAQAAARRKRQEQQEASRSKMATIAIISCSLVAVVAIIIFLVVLLNGGISSNKGKLIEVPNFVGEEYVEVSENDLFDVIPKEVYDENVEAGLIIEQEPKAGDKVVSGTKIVLTVSLGPTPQIMTMPDFTDVVSNKAQNQLKSMGINLSIKIEEEYHEEIVEGVVIRTKPDVGTELKPGDKVTLYISKGAEMKTGVMPNVVGAEQKKAEETLNKQNLDLVIIVEEVFDSEYPAGQVVRTNPEKGEDLKSQQEVILTVSKGPELAKLPNVIGMDVETAVNLIQAAGFEMPDIKQVDSNEPKDTVVNQSHKGNTKIDVNSVIILEISKGPQTPENTTPTVVTKNVVIDLKDTLSAADAKVTVTCNGVSVFNDTVPQSTKSITIQNQRGFGTMNYYVDVEGHGSWVQPEVFSGNG